jgi:hypothetical protein
LAYSGLQQHHDTIIMDCMVKAVGGPRPGQQYVRRSTEWVEVVVGFLEVIQLLAFEGAFCEMWPSRRVRAQNHGLLPVNTASQHYLGHRRDCTRAVIVTMSSSVLSSLPYHEHHEENHRKAEDDVDDFATRQARVMCHLRGRKRKDECSTDCATFSCHFN